MKRILMNWNKAFGVLASIVNVITYLVIVVGAIKVLIFSFSGVTWTSLAKTVILTAFAVYINLKNPNV